MPLAGDSSSIGLGPRLLEFEALIITTACLFARSKDIGQESREDRKLSKVKLDVTDH
jgi:hypothetical protein